MGLRVAVLLQGEPRFCEEFDYFLENLIGYERVDWFCYLWQSSPATSNIIGHDGHQLVAPQWQNIDLDWAVDKFKGNLPEGHNLAVMKLADQTTIVHPEITENYAVETNQANVWKMWYSLREANQLRLDYEKASGVKYDIVIRTRPDVMLCDHVDMRYVDTHIKNHPNLVIIPRNRLCGYSVAITDLFAMTSSRNMNIYVDLYNQALDHHKRGVKFHPETMLAKHLLHNKLFYNLSNVDIEFRHLGTWVDPKTGETWDSQSVLDWDTKNYISKFGRWE